MANHSSLSGFGREMHRKAAKVDSAMLKIVKDTVVAVVESVAADTPILSGQAQSNWLTNIGEPFPYWNANAWQNAAWHESVSFAKAVLQNAKPGDVIHITNNLPYIVKLNQGYSRQAPAMFVESAVLRATYRLRGTKIDLS